MIAATTRSRAGRRARGSQLVRAAGPAVTLDLGVTGGVVVVAELFALANRARRANPDDAVLDVSVAVRLARVVDEPRDVAADASVDHPAGVQREASDLSLLQVPILAVRAFLVGDLLALVVDDADRKSTRLNSSHDQ